MKQSHCRRVAALAALAARSETLGAILLLCAALLFGVVITLSHPKPPKPVPQVFKRLQDTVVVVLVTNGVGNVIPVEIPYPIWISTNQFIKSVKAEADK
jgi:hypothetical protein